MLFNCTACGVIYLAMFRIAFYLHAIYPKELITFVGVPLSLTS